jgi:hypothetical protein
MKPSMLHPVVMPAAVLATTLLTVAALNHSSWFVKAAPPGIERGSRSGKRSLSNRFMRRVDETRGAHSAGRPSGAGPGGSLSVIFGISFQEAGNLNYSAPVRLNSGGIMVVFPSPKFSPIYASKTLDGGASWSNPVEITSAIQSDGMAGQCTMTGRILLIMREFSHYNLYECHSDDEGETWSKPIALDIPGILNRPSLGRSKDGKCWLFYNRLRQDNYYDWPYEIVYRTTADGGKTWSGERVFFEGGSEWSRSSMVQAPWGAIIVVFDRLKFDDSSAIDPAKVMFESHLFIRSSMDGGATWSEPERLTGKGAYAVNPELLTGEDGRIRLIYNNIDITDQSGPCPYRKSVVEMRTLSADGENWLDPVTLTRYAGSNDLTGACLFEGLPFFMFTSDRSPDSRPLWAGLAGRSRDSNPPPVFIGSMIPEIRPGRKVFIQVKAADETGLESVTYAWESNHGQGGPLPMRNNGKYPDLEAGDLIWSAEAGPFDAPERIRFRYQIRDLQSNTIEAEEHPFEIPLLHDTGNIVLGLPEEGTMGSWHEPLLGAYWPRTGGAAYLRTGGFWVGGKVKDRKCVNISGLRTTEWVQSGKWPYRIGRDVSDQDVEVRYDNSGLSPGNIGLWVRQRSLQWSDPSRDDFILFNYTLTNPGMSGDLDSLFAALWTNPDVGWNDRENNLAGYDAARHMAYVFNASNKPAGYFGVRLLSVGNAPHSVIAHEYVDPEVQPELEDADLYDLMSAGRVDLRNALLSTGVTDIKYRTLDFCLLVSTPAFSLASGDSVTVSFGVVLGNGLPELQANADTMKAVYDRLRGI